jgi:hypothetical protein
MLDIDMFMKLAPASVATALASIVFPVPGGPKSSIPLHGWCKIHNSEIRLLSTNILLCIAGVTQRTKSVSYQLNKK